MYCHLKLCTFIYNSSEVSNGTFSTPNYPGVYPRDTECHYLFYGKSNEKIYIEFAYFDVEGVPPCLSDTASDYVEFSNFRTVDRKIPRHCGNLRPTKIESDADFFRVSFKSNDKFDGTGFEAFYQFRNNPDPFTVRQVSAVQNKQNGGRAAMGGSLKHIPTNLRPATLEEWLADSAPDIMKALKLLGLSYG
ncbi:hypothetical protein HPB52_018458 [Rhipicephalus sanguineus]|uniref:CUB domain-containing protein n=1 Tax=Rhipicephalus sanguineus TaxID=34632 RepID=A0A9D4PPF2_RHISA|nr:hypothetical protein HPB52_018458 [Rhipicephalus sanguineus]